MNTTNSQSNVTDFLNNLNTMNQVSFQMNIFDFNYLSALNPVNINKEVNMLHRSVHIFCKTIRDKFAMR